MKVVLLVVGKTVERYFIDAIQEYCNRLKFYIPFELEVVPELKSAKNMTEAVQREKEAELIRKALHPGDYVVLLDEKGKELASKAFAVYLERKMHTVTKRLVFIVGGPYGFAEQIYERAAEKLSLSKMTFSHQMIRLLFVEQLYRAMTILHNEPYHHE